MRTLPLLLLIGTAALISACRPDETVRAYGAADKVWTLTELRGAPFDAAATLEFPERDQIAGSGPCNRFTATQNVPYPWFGVGPIAATRMACPDLEAETAYFNALAEASVSVITKDTLTLSDENDVLLVFKSGD